MATSGTAYRQILKELENGIYKTVYYLMGDEPFFIDSISDYIREHALPEEARDFNQIVLYGNETTMNEGLSNGSRTSGDNCQGGAAPHEEGFRGWRKPVGYSVIIS